MIVVFVIASIFFLLTSLRVKNILFRDAIGGINTIARILFFYAKATLKSPEIFGGKVKTFLKKVKKGVLLSLKRNSDLSLKGKF